MTYSSTVILTWLSWNGQNDLQMDAGMLLEGNSSPELTVRATTHLVEGHKHNL